jgi:hypothetical protein
MIYNPRPPNALAMQMQEDFQVAYYPPVQNLTLHSMAHLHSTAPEGLSDTGYAQR